MTKTQAWIHAFRLRTLPLALSSIVMGAFVALHHDGFRWEVSALAALTTILLQILSNLANDYGDSSHGVDNTERVGPERAVQSGVISSKEMKRAAILFTALSFISGMALLFFSFGEALLALRFWIFLLLGFGAIAAAIKYTAGKNPYGYSGYGDLFVFLFFGLVGVIGTYYLNTGILKWQVIFPAISIGLFSTGVLNINNMRDIENDRESGKRTLVVKMGKQKAKYYHLFLVSGGMASAMLYTFLNFNTYTQLGYIVGFPLLIRNIQVVFSNHEAQKLDPYLKQLAISTLLFAILFGISGLF